MTDVLLASVPENETTFATAHLPGALTTEAPLSRELVEAHPTTRVLSVAYHDPVTPALLDGFEDLEVVITRSDGYDHVPLGYLEDRGLAAFHLEDYAVPAVVEYTVATVIALLRRFPEALVETGEPPVGWDRGPLQGRGLPEVTVGVLGVGRIGSGVVRAIAGLGGQLRGYDIAPDRELEAEVEAFTYTESYRALLAASDVLTVHVPLTEQTRGMVDTDALSRLPEGACLVNAARGDVVDQAAVIGALATGQLAGYAADVLPGEPDPPDLQALAGLDRVMVTPHLAAYDGRTLDERFRRTGAIVEAWRAGQLGDVDHLRLL